MPRFPAGQHLERIVTGTAEFQFHDLCRTPEIAARLDGQREQMFIERRSFDVKARHP